MNVYTIFDCTSEEYTLPFYQKNDKCAVRAFLFQMNKPDFVNCRNEFKLFRIGSFDSDTGVLISSDPFEVSIVDSALGVKYE